MDKYAHVLLYGILTVLASRSLVGSNVRRPAMHAFWIAVAIGIADEGLQSLGGVRTADRFDLLADAVGAAIAISGTALLRSMRERSRRTD